MIVVTGGAGFIGRHLVSLLERRGESVVAIDRLEGSAGSSTTWICCDLTDPSPDAVAALTDADAVFHLAARPGVRDADPEIAHLRRQDNVVAAGIVLALVPRRTPVVVTSSSSVYGGAIHGGTERPCHEDDPLRPRGGYARSKVAMEALCERRRAAGGSVAVLRPFTVAGEGQRSDMAIARWLDASSKGDRITVLGSLQRSRDITDVRDVAAALVAALDRSVTGTVNVGTGAAWSLADILAAVFEATGSPTELVQVSAPAAEVPATLAHTGRCASLLGFVPHTDLRSLVARQWAATQDRPMAAAAREALV